MSFKCHLLLIDIKLHGLGMEAYHVSYYWTGHHGYCCHGNLPVATCIHVYSGHCRGHCGFVYILYFHGYNMANVARQCQLCYYSIEKVITHTVVSWFRMYDG